jgi:hypothetical protein
MQRHPIFRVLITPAGHVVDVEETYHNHLVILFNDKPVKITTREILHDQLGEVLSEVDTQISRLSEASTCSEETTNPEK